jgi:hypothetical protein
MLFEEFSAHATADRKLCVFRNVFARVKCTHFHAHSSKIVLERLMCLLLIILFQLDVRGISIMQR